MTGFEDDPDEFDFDAFMAEEDAQALTPEGIAEANAAALSQFSRFRQAADTVTDAWRTRPEVQAVTLIGSLAIMPWKEVSRHSPYRQEKIRLWHECGDVDLAVWLTDLEDLNGLRRIKGRALNDQLRRTGNGTAPHRIDTFLLEPGTDRYLGRLCHFNTCPKGKQACRVPGCGDQPFLQQHAQFRWRSGTLDENRSVRLFDRATGSVARAADLPLPGRMKVVGEGWSSV